MMGCPADGLFGDASVGSLGLSNFDLHDRHTQPSHIDKMDSVVGKPMIKAVGLEADLRVAKEASISWHVRPFLNIQSLFRDIIRENNLYIFKESNRYQCLYSERNYLLRVITTRSRLKGKREAAKKLKPLLQKPNTKHHLPPFCPKLFPFSYFPHGPSVFARSKIMTIISLNIDENLKP